MTGAGSHPYLKIEIRAVPFINGRFNRSIYQEKKSIKNQEPQNQFIIPRNRCKLSFSERKD
jgi:hypothetical protein